MIKKSTRPKIGLALGMGGARALAHIGVIKVLEEAGIEIDCIAGVSMGALIGAGYAMDLGIRRIETIALETDWKHLFSLMDVHLPAKGLIDGNRIEDFIKSHIGYAQFSETKISLSIVATNIESGERVVFKEGSIAKAVHASLSIPIFFKPYNYKGKLYLDGGLTDPVPVDLAREMGADFVIAISSFQDLKKYFSENGDSAERLKSLIGPRRLKKFVSSCSDRIEQPEVCFDEGKNIARNVREVAARTIGIMEEHIALPQLKEADLVIIPDLKGIGMLDFVQAKQIICRGEKAALKVLAGL